MHNYQSVSSSQHVLLYMDILELQANTYNRKLNISRYEIKSANFNSVTAHIQFMNLFQAQNPIRKHEKSAISDVVNVTSKWTASQKLYWRFPSANYPYRWDISFRVVARDSRVKLSVLWGEICGDKNRATSPNLKLYHSRCYSIHSLLKQWLQITIINNITQLKL